MSAPPPPGWGPPPGGVGRGGAGGGYPEPPPPRPTAGSARTGPLPLAPMGVGEILDGAFKLYRANFKPIALVALAFAGPLSIVAAVAVRDVNGGSSLLDVLSDPSLAEDSGSFGSGSQLFLQVFTTLLLGLSGSMVAGVVATAVAASYLGGQLTAGQALRSTARFFPALVAARVLVWLTEAVGLLGCGIGAVAVMALWVVTAPAIVVEGLGPFRGMRRSLVLCSARYWPVLGIALLSGLIGFTLSNIVSGVPSVIATLIGYRWGFPLLAVGSTASAVLVEPLVAIVSTLVYFDLRIRQEGLDLQLIARGDRSGATPGA